MYRITHPRDVERIAEIHHKFYRDEFEFREIYNNAIHRYSILNDNNLIVAGAVRTLLEVTAVTDKNFSVRTRRQALLEALEVSKYVARKSNHHELHLFIQDPAWESTLINHGFRPTRGKSLVIEV